MIDHSRIRKEKYWCAFCKEEWEVKIPFGCFLEVVEGSRMELMQERQGTNDVPIGFVSCPNCGCVCGSKKVKSPN